MNVLVMWGLVSLAIAGCLLLHHGYKHSDKEDPSNFHAQEESCAAVCYFQLSDISNHETWIILFVGVAIVLFCVSQFACV